ncbi:DUF2726 domain-containing protein [Methylibium sp.]|uniref:DUF2726 domain-containing protein n=1 Tax=Methylibium sp. TaxID=2067992 RepID=UPI003D0BFF2F
MGDPIVLQVLAVLLAGLMLVALARRRGDRGRGGRERPESPGRDMRDKRVEALDTVAAWPPEATRVLTLKERKAQLVLQQALPEYTVLAQVPLARFIRVPTRNSYHEWMRRVGQICADLVVCDAVSQVVAIVEVRRPPGKDGERTVRRHERMDRVLQQAGIRVIVWNEDALPSIAAVRDQLVNTSQGLRTEDGGGHVRTRPAAVMPGVLVTETAGAVTARQTTVTLQDVLEDLDREAADGATLAEPAQSTWFDDLSSASMPLDAPSR